MYIYIWVDWSICADGKKLISIPETSNPSRPGYSWVAFKSGPPALDMMLRKTFQHDLETFAISLPTASNWGRYTFLFTRDPTSVGLCGLDSQEAFDPFQLTSTIRWKGLRQLFDPRGIPTDLHLEFKHSMPVIKSKNGEHLNHRANRKSS